MSLNNDFLQMCCKKVGKIGSHEIEQSFQQQLLSQGDNKAQEYGGFIQFIDQNQKGESFLYVTKSNSIIREYLMSEGREIDKSGNIPVLSINTMFVDLETQKKIETSIAHCSGSNQYEEVCVNLLKDKELQTSLALNGDKILSRPEEMNLNGMTSISTYCDILKSYSEYFNPEKYTNTFLKLVGPKIETALGQKGDSIQNNNTNTI